MLVYHAKRLSPIEAVCYLSFFDYTAASVSAVLNSLKYDIAVIYCIFVSVSDIRYRS